MIWPRLHLRFHLSSHWQGMTLSLITVQATNLTVCLQVFEQTASLCLEHHFPICSWNISLINYFLTCPSRTNHSTSLCTVHGFYSWHSHHFTALNSHKSSSHNNVKLTPLEMWPYVGFTGLASATRPGSLHMPTNDSLNKHTGVSFHFYAPGKHYRGLLFQIGKILGGYFLNMRGLINMLIL